jgi:hypothetical protein
MRFSIKISKVGMKELSEFDCPLFAKTWHEDLPIDSAIVKCSTELGTPVIYRRNLFTKGHMLA